MLGDRSSAPRILFTDTHRWAIAARLAVALAKAGCEVSAICPTRGHPIARVRSVERIFPYRSLYPLSSLAAAIEAAQPHIIIPCDERGVRHLHELFFRSHGGGMVATNIAALIKRSLGSPESYAVVTSRNHLLAVARGQGICVPETQPVRSVDDLDSWGAEHALPWVLKADGTFGGSGVRIAHTLEQAKRFYSDMCHPYRTANMLKRVFIYRDLFSMKPWWNHSPQEIIVQSFVRGRPANCAVACWEGRILAGIAVEVVASVSDVGPATVVRLVDSPEMMSGAERLARRLGLSGFFGLDFMIEDGSRRAHLIEMNPRCTPLSHLQLGKGRDMVTALAAQLLPQAIEEVPSVTENELIAYFPQAWTYNPELLCSCFQDIPDDPELTQTLSKPWLEQTLMFRLSRARAARAISSKLLVK